MEMEELLAGSEYGEDKEEDLMELMPFSLSSIAPSGEGHGDDDFSRTTQLHRLLSAYALEKPSPMSLASSEGSPRVFKTPNPNQIICESSPYNVLKTVSGGKSQQFKSAQKKPLSQMNAKSRASQQIYTPNTMDTNSKENHPPVNFVEQNSKAPKSMRGSHKRTMRRTRAFTRLELNVPSNADKITSLKKEELEGISFSGGLETFGLSEQFKSASHSSNRKLLRLESEFGKEGKHQQNTEREDLRFSNEVGPGSYSIYNPLKDSCMVRMNDKGSSIKLGMKGQEPKSTKSSQKQSQTDEGTTSRGTQFELKGTGRTRVFTKLELNLSAEQDMIADWDKEKLTEEEETFFNTGNFDAFNVGEKLAGQKNSSKPECCILDVEEEARSSQDLVLKYKLDGGQHHSATLGMNVGEDCKQIEAKCSSSQLSSDVTCHPILSLKKLGSSNVSDDTKEGDVGCYIDSHLEEIVLDSAANQFVCLKKNPSSIESENAMYRSFLRYPRPRIDKVATDNSFVEECSKRAIHISTYGLALDMDSKTMNDAEDAYNRANAALLESPALELQRMKASIAAPDTSPTPPSNPLVLLGLLKWERCSQRVDGNICCPSIATSQNVPVTRTYRQVGAADSEVFPNRSAAHDEVEANSSLPTPDFLDLPAHRNDLTRRAIDVGQRKLAFSTLSPISDIKHKDGAETDGATLNSAPQTSSEECAQLLVQSDGCSEEFEKTEAAQGTQALQTSPEECVQLLVESDGCSEESENTEAAQGTQEANDCISISEIEERGDMLENSKLLVSEQNLKDISNKDDLSLQGSLHQRNVEGSLEHTEGFSTKDVCRKVVRRKRADDSPGLLASGAGTIWKDGARRSTRIRLKPVEYWRGEKVLYGRVHKSLVSVIGLKHASPFPPWPRKGWKQPNFKIESFVAEQYDHLVKYAAI